MSPQLKVCASCEWIFKNKSRCPKCGFAWYGAHYVYGNKCYSYVKTQKPWFDKKMANYAAKLYQEIEKGDTDYGN